MNQDESIRFAAKFLEDLLSFFGINVAVRSTFDEEVIKLSVPSTSMNSILIGRHADNIYALQHIISAALIFKRAELYRVNIDIADYRRQHEERIIAKAEDWLRTVRSTGRTLRLNLSPSDRRLVHKLAEDYSDLKTYSEGVGRERQIIIEKIATSKS